MQIRLIKESPRGSVRLIRHRATGQKFILRRFTGNGEVYRMLLDCSCPNLPKVFEVAEQGEENIVIEEFIEGDTLGFLLQDVLFSPEETCAIVAQVCRALWVLHSMTAVHRDVKPENVILRGLTRSSSTLTPPGCTSLSTRPTRRFWAPRASPLRSSTVCPSRTSGRISTPWGCSSTLCSQESTPPKSWRRGSWAGWWYAVPRSIPRKDIRTSSA